MKEFPSPLLSYTCAALSRMAPNEPFWLLMIGDSVMRGMFHDIVDVMYQHTNTPREHIRQGSTNTYRRDDFIIQHEFWYATQNRPLPLDGKAASKVSWEVPAVSDDAYWNHVSLPHVIFFSSQSWDIGRSSMKQYTTALIRTLSWLNTWKERAEERQKTKQPTLRIPRFIWNIPTAEFQWKRVEELLANLKKDKRLRSECFSNYYGRSRMSSHLSLPLVRQLTPFIELFDGWSLSDMRPDLAWNQHFDKLWCTPYGWVSRAISQVFLNVMCFGGKQKDNIIELMMQQDMANITINIQDL